MMIKENSALKIIVLSGILGFFSCAGANDFGVSGQNNKTTAPSLNQLLSRTQQASSNGLPQQAVTQNVNSTDASADNTSDTDESSAASDSTSAADENANATENQQTTNNPDNNTQPSSTIVPVSTQPQQVAAPSTPSVSPSSSPASDAAAKAALGDSAVSTQAFANMVRNMMPLSPDQIKTLRYLFDQSQKAAATFPGTPPKPTSSSVLVDLSPGATPPIIRLRAGFVTSLVFLDSTGQPWPVQAYDLGDPQSFNVEWDQKSNTLLVQAISTYKSGNLAVMLKGQNTPVMVTLMPGQRAIDYRVDLRVPGLGPNATPLFTDLPSSENPQLLNFLNGVPPMGAQSVEVTGGPCQAWMMNGHLYLRTQLMVVSPSWLASMSSPDGTHVYELPKTPIVLASYRGQLVKLIMQGL